MKPPYDRQWGTLDGFKVMIVDGGWIRSEKDISFTNFDQHWHNKPYIPAGEVWVDDSVDKQEIPVLARAAVREAKMMRSGATYARAEGVASKVEVAERKNDPAAHAKVKIRKMGGNSKLTVWEVNGEAVRDRFDDEFTEGGHGRVYPWIPKNEIWLEKDATPAKDEEPNFLHELFEYNRMGNGARYERAHHAALTEAELPARRDPSKLPKLMAKEEELSGGPLNMKWRM